ncbi:MAG: transcription-repair coupling factor [Armatimonadota bacterium]
MSSTVEQQQTTFRKAVELPGLSELVDQCLAGQALEIDGVSGNLTPLLLAGCWHKSDKNMLVVVGEQENSETLLHDLQQCGVPEESIVSIPAMTPLMFEDTPADTRLIGTRIEALSKIALSQRVLVLARLQALCEPTIPVADLADRCFMIDITQEYDIDKMCKQLYMLGYEREEMVAHRGQYSRRGGIVDIFPAHAMQPIRCEFFGDEIERLNLFDPETQRSVQSIDRILITPAREVIWQTSDSDGAVLYGQEILEAQMAVVAKRGHASANTMNRLMSDDFVSLENQVCFDRLEQYIGWLHPGSSVLDYVRGFDVYISDPSRIASDDLRTGEEAADIFTHRYRRGEIFPIDELWKDLPSSFLPGSAVGERLAQVCQGNRWVALSSFESSRDLLPIESRININGSALPGYRGQGKVLQASLSNWMANGCTVAFLTEQPKRLAEILQEWDMIDSVMNETLAPGKLGLFRCRFSAGFAFEQASLFVITDAELFGANRMRVTRSRLKEGVPLSSLLDLREGDYVVHINHGVGIFRGIVSRNVLGVRRDYLLIHYKAPDTLLVPTDQIDRIQRYIGGGEDHQPELNRLGGTEWHQAKRKAKQKAQAIAADLVKLYAARQAADRPPYSADSPWQQELESSFPYEETPDQRKAIVDVKRDMEITRRPMDRLVCGDVGFGKTEVAIRAIFKAVTENRQVAVLCPTTVLAAQHFSTLQDRFAPYPVTVALLNRFCTPKEAKLTIERLKNGEVDVVVGTHMLLGKTVNIPKLGLLVVDEEQRFGVRHKEKMKQLKENVDVLTLSATPIPRTLHMALGGLRSMSVINDPPFGRLPVRTIVRAYDEDVIREAILRELGRGGQVFFVHNRVQSIYHVADHIQKLVPSARVMVGHGQMPDEELERVMEAVYAHECDVLLSTTIIENGIDVSNANTLIIENAHRMGLAQLYQLRGRVGRSDRQAYAYFLYRHEASLDVRAEQRLDAIRQFSGLGSGLKVAMRDLEIRGAGDLLGQQQSGAMESVGFELYTQLLSEAILEERGETEDKLFLPPVDIPINAFIPDGYISNEAQRILVYKRMAGTKTVDELAELRNELEDRYGPIPSSLKNGLGIIGLRFAAAAIHAQEVKAEPNGWVVIRFMPGHHMNTKLQKTLALRYRNEQFMPDAIRLSISTAPNPLIKISEVISNYRDYRDRMTG